MKGLLFVGCKSAGCRKSEKSLSIVKESLLYQTLETQVSGPEGSKGVHHLCFDCIVCEDFAREMFELFLGSS